MKIYIEDSKIRTRMMDQTLFLVKSYKYVTRTFKKKAEEDVKIAEKDISSSELEFIIFFLFFF